MEFVKVVENDYLVKTNYRGKDVGVVLSNLSPIRLKGFEEGHGLEAINKYFEEYFRGRPQPRVELARYVIQGGYAIPYVLYGVSGIYRTNKTSVALRVVKGDYPEDLVNSVCRYSDSLGKDGKVDPRLVRLISCNVVCDDGIIVAVGLMSNGEYEFVNSDELVAMVRDGEAIAVKVGKRIKRVYCNDDNILYFIGSRGKRYGIDIPSVALEDLDAPIDDKWCIVDNFEKYYGYSLSSGVKDKLGRRKPSLGS